jgi:hypothetical protein
MEQNAADMSERPYPDEGVMVAQLKVARAILDAQRQNPGRVHGPALLEEVDTFYRRLARVTVDRSRT